jgi:hypothetical protein
MSRRLIALALCLLPGLAVAHHGQDFLLVESPGLPHPGDIYFIANSSFALSDATEQAGIEPALLVGVTHRVAFELHVHTAKIAGEDWRYEATAPAIHVLLTDPERHDGLKVGLSAEYEVAAEHGAQDNFELRLSAQNGNEHTKLAGNLIFDRQQHNSGEFGAAFALRHQFNAGFAAGFEAQGSFKHAEGAEILAAGYWEHDQSWGLKLGLGAQKDDKNHFSPMAHVGVVIRIRD